MSTIFLKEKEREREIMKDVVSLESSEDGLIMTDIMGEEKRIKARIELVDLIRHRIVLCGD